MIIKGNSVGFPLPDPRKGMDMNGNAINNLANPLNSGDAANKGYVDGGIADAKKYADDKHFELTITIPASAWYHLSGSVYEASMAIPNLLGSDMVDIDVYFTDHSAEGQEGNIALEEEFVKIFLVTYIDGKMWFKARELPTADLPIRLKVVR